MTLGRDHANDGNRSTLIGMSERIGVRHSAACGRGGDQRRGFSVDAVQVRGRVGGERGLD